MKMKLLLECKRPDDLKARIIKRVEEGKQETWKILIHENIKYLQHIGQWAEKGVVSLTNNFIPIGLAVEVLPFKNVKESNSDFEGYLLGRFFEIIFVNYSDEFTSIKKG